MAYPALYGAGELGGRQGEPVGLADACAPSLDATFGSGAIAQLALPWAARGRAVIAPDLSGLGPVAVKYDPRNPANSIVLAEEWSGLRLK